MTLVRSVLNLVRELSDTVVRENSACNCKLGLKVWTQLPPQLRPGMAWLVVRPGTLPALGLRTSLFIRLERNQTESDCPKVWSSRMLYSFWCWVFGSVSNALLLKTGSKVPAAGSTL